MYQFDLDIAIKCMKSVSGVYEKLDNDDNDAPGVVTDEQWSLIQQYKGAMEPVYQFIKFTQNATVIAHEEPFEAIVGN